MGGKNHHPSPNMGSATAGMHGERAGVLGMSPRGSWNCCVFFFFFSRSLPSHRLYCWVEDGAVKLSRLGSLSFHAGLCTSFFPNPLVISCFSVT